METQSLLCTEQVCELPRTPSPNSRRIQPYEPQPQPQIEQRLSVPALTDLHQLKDDRVLQNLLRDEERFIPQVPDYLQHVQVSHR